MLPVAADQHVRASSESRGDDAIVGRIAAARRHLGRDPGDGGGDFLDQREDCVNDRLVEAKLYQQHTPKLGLRRLWQDRACTPVGDHLEHPAGRSVGDHRRDEHVRIERYLQSSRLS